MIYVTGDTHGEFERFSTKRMKRSGLMLEANDYVIVCGDCGLCWEQDGTFAYHCKNFARKPYTILWVQGNHENYDMIEKYPMEEWHGGKVRHIVRDKVILLERGQVFEIEGKTFFTFGGASTHDIEAGVLDRSDPAFTQKQRQAKRLHQNYRIIHESWWPQEMPSDEEIEEAIHNLERVNYKVDYVISHCCCTELQEKIMQEKLREYKEDKLTEFFQQLEGKLKYRKWYFGHYHDNSCMDEKHTLLYMAIVRLGEDIPLNDFSIKGRP